MTTAIPDAPEGPITNESTGLHKYHNPNATTERFSGLHPDNTYPLVDGKIDFEQEKRLQARQESDRTRRVSSDSPRAPHPSFTEKGPDATLVEEQYLEEHPHVPHAPTVTGITPSTGAQAGGTVVTLNGTRLTGATGVTVGGIAATGLTVNNNSQLHFTTPASGSTGAKAVVVQHPAGNSTQTVNFTYT